jgi:hypothetical protein
MEYGAQTLEIDMNWFNGSADEFYLRYGGEVPAPAPAPAPTGGTMTSTTYPNGVQVVTDRLYESDLQILIIPRAAIKFAGYCEMKGGGLAQELAQELAGDIVFNATPFDTRTWAPNLGLRVNGKTITPYVAYNPWAGWTGDKSLLINHPQKDFTLPNVSQGFRYIIENGAKNSRWNSSASSIEAWAALEPRQIIAQTNGGSTVILTVKGRDTNQRGMTLHEIAEICLTHPSFAADKIRMGIDLDGGYSTQTVHRVNGQDRLFIGASRQDLVPVFGEITLNKPLQSTEPAPEPEPEPTPPPAGTTREIIETKTMIDPDGAIWTGEAHFVLTKQ